MIRLQLQVTSRVNIREILCSSTLLVYATYISGQQFLRPVQQYKYDQIFLSMKRDSGKKTELFWELHAWGDVF